MLGTILGRQNTSGAEAEAQRAWGLEGDAIPMSMVSELRPLPHLPMVEVRKVLLGTPFPTLLPKLRISPASWFRQGSTPTRVSKPLGPLEGRRKALPTAPR